MPSFVFTSWNLVILFPFVLLSMQYNMGGRRVKGERGDFLRDRGFTGGESCAINNATKMTTQGNKTMAKLYIVKRNGIETARTYVQSEALSLVSDYIQGNQTLQFNTKAQSVTIETQKG